MNFVMQSGSKGLDKGEGLGLELVFGLELRFGLVLGVTYELLFSCQNILLCWCTLLLINFWLFFSVKWSKNIATVLFSSWSCGNMLIHRFSIAVVWSGHQQQNLRGDDLWYVTCRAATLSSLDSRSETYLVMPLVLSNHPLQWQQSVDLPCWSTATYMLEIMDL